MDTEHSERDLLLSQAIETAEQSQKAISERDSLILEMMTRLEKQKQQLLEKDSIISELISESGRIQFSKSPMRRRTQKILSGLQQIRQNAVQIKELLEDSAEDRDLGFGTDQEQIPESQDQSSETEQVTESQNQKSGTDQEQVTESQNKRAIPDNTQMLNQYRDQLIYTRTLLRRQMEMQQNQSKEVEQQLRSINRLITGKLTGS